MYIGMYLLVSRSGRPRRYGVRFKNISIQIHMNDESVKDDIMGNGFN